jgi:tRNA threonylcarbamoyladenosine modification (KEOPS) complex  Pcc1 subunit
MTRTACFSFSFQTLDDAKVVADALLPEIIHRIPKTKVEIKIENTILLLTITAKELSSLRAACNSYLRWIDTAIKVAKLG